MGNFKSKGETKMENGNRKSLTDIYKKYVNKDTYSLVSFILAVSLIAILLVGFLFCFIVSFGSFSENGMSAVWWLFVFLIWAMIPLTFVANILSIFFGIKALLIKRSIFSLVGIMIVLLEVIAVISMF